MAYSQCFPPIAITSLILLYLTCLPFTTLSQNSGPTIADCAPRLLPLATCAPFVQGTAPSPAQQCCDSIKQLYNQQPNCLCLLLNDTTLSSFPINRTLALQLPLLCNLQISTSTCSGVPLPPSSPASQVSFGTKNNSSVGASPMVTVAPRPSIMGLGVRRSGGLELKAERHLVVVVVAAMAFMLLF
ncbi:hypothetical protein F0562_023804 [Nyssa sinensis]|uniref:Bifunctional inhibitor/plant lipid transfer protein/seed storage helical domain-containing protein n=1 Tax=Nyssa sinensis TaxID=561372 RepID=A0A5J5BLL5_9ASTE|nr:hypothetical protein F0562_023804 [Nyssa sinensis]